MRTRRAIKRVVVPSSIVLTATVLTSALRRLPSGEIEGAIDALIEELDRRSGDADFEAEVDAEDEWMGLSVTSNSSGENHGGAGSLSSAIIS